MVKETRNQSDMKASEGGFILSQCQTPKTGMSCNTLFIFPFLDMSII